MALGAHWTGMGEVHQMTNKWDGPPLHPIISGVPITATQGQTLNPAQRKRKESVGGHRQAYIALPF